MKELVYAAYMVFATTDPRLGKSAEWAPLWGENAAKMRPEIFLRRRLYAIEFWVAFGGFAAFVAMMCKRRHRRPPHSHGHGPAVGGGWGGPPVLCMITAYLYKAL